MQNVQVDEIAVHDGRAVAHGEQLDVAAVPEAEHLRAVGRAPIPLVPVEGIVFFDGEIQFVVPAEVEVERQAHLVRAAEIGARQFDVEIGLHARRIFPIEAVVVFLPLGRGADGYILVLIPPRPERKLEPRIDGDVRPVLRCGVIGEHEGRDETFVLIPADEIIAFLYGVLGRLHRRVRDLQFQPYPAVHHIGDGRGVFILAPVRTLRRARGGRRGGKREQHRTDRRGNFPETHSKKTSRMFFLCARHGKKKALSEESALPSMPEAPRQTCRSFSVRGNSRESPGTEKERPLQKGRPHRQYPFVRLRSNFRNHL